MKMQSKKKQQYDEPTMTVDELSKALYESNTKLANNIREQKDFFYNISHDLRSPIAAIRGAIEYLESDNSIDDKKRTEMYSLIDAKSKSLEFMIEEIFLLTKLGTNEKLLKPAVVPCGNYLEDYFFTNELDPKYKDLNLFLDVPMEFEWGIYVDTNYMNRVLDNLFENARRHTAKGGSITLSAKLSDDNSSAVIEVRDTGEGIEQNDIARVFDKSFMSDASRTPGSESGAGLGLSICKRIVELSNGTISCTSSTGEDHGTAFTIMLPVCQS